LTAPFFYAKLQPTPGATARNRPKGEHSMARRSGQRKTRMWFTLMGWVPTPAIGCNNFNLTLVEESATIIHPGAGDVISILRGPSGPLSDLESNPGFGTVYAAREFTVSAMHMSCNMVDSAGATIRPMFGAVGVGIQGGGPGGVSQLPGLMDNSQTGQWPLVVPIKAAGESGSSRIFTACGSTSSQRKVAFGQAIYGSAIIGDNPPGKFGIIVRCLALL